MTSEDDEIAESYIRMQGVLRGLTEQLRQMNARSAAELAETKTLAAEVKRSSALRTHGSAFGSETSHLDALHMVIIDPLENVIDEEVEPELISEEKAMENTAPASYVASSAVQKSDSSAMVEPEKKNEGPLVNISEVSTANFVNPRQGSHLGFSCEERHKEVHQIQDRFVEHKALSPLCSCDHKISLKQGTIYPSNIPAILFVPFPAAILFILLSVAGGLVAFTWVASSIWVAFLGLDSLS